MNESEVLRGTALLVLGMTDDLFEESRKMPRVIIGLFQRCYRSTPARCATNIIWSDTAFARKSGMPTSDEPEELAVVQFASAAGVCHMLTTGLELVSKGQAMGLELRRGYIKLGPHRLLVEGVVKPETPKLNAADATPSHTTAHRAELSDPTAFLPSPGPHDKAERSPPSRASSVPSPTSSSSSSSSSSSTSVPPQGQNAPVPASAAAASEANRPGGAAQKMDDGQIALPHEPETRVVFFTMRRLYARPDQPGGGDRRGDDVADYPITPYTVFELVRGIAYPRKVLVLPARGGPRRHPSSAGPAVQMVNILVEFASLEAANKVIQTLNEQVVEFMSHSPGRTVRRAGDPTAQQVEARFSLHLHVSFKKSRTGVETVQKELAFTGRNDRYAMVVPPLESFDDPRLHFLRERVTPPFPRKWVPDEYGVVHGSPAGGGAAAAAESSRAGREREQRHRHDNDSDEERSRRGGKRTRSRSPPRMERDRDARRGRPEPVHASASSASTINRPVERAFQQKSKSAPSSGANHVAAASRFVRPPTLPGVVTTPVSAPAVVSPTALPGTAVLSSHVAASPKPVTVLDLPATTVPPPPPLMSDHLGVLPFGWRPIFSQEYQQVYYAYRDQASGQERTTWVRPAS